MFVHNRTALTIAASTLPVAERTIVSVSFWAAYRYVDGALEAIPRQSGDDDVLLRVAACADTSWSLRGTVLAQDGEASCQDVLIRAGERPALGIRVFGDRVWLGRGDELVPSAPRPFERIDLDSRLAFGGKHELPPGELHGLPHPQMTLAEPRNPNGRGYYPDAMRAAGGALPNVEFLDDLCQRWSDRPEPAVLAPGPTDAVLKITDPSDPTCLLHPAHRRAIGPRIRPGSDFVISGARPSPIAFCLPESPARVELRQRRAWVSCGHHIRHIAIDLNSLRVEILFSHAAHHARDVPVTDARVTRAA